MKFGNDSSVTVENNGKNQGIIAGANYGPIIQNQYGLGYSDTKALCLEIVHDEISKYRAEALAEAQRRSEDLFERIVHKLETKQMNDSQALAEFGNPAMQFDYLEAQKAYMKVGTPELAEMLSDILVERISESSRSLLQIALGEAIQVVPKLMPSQMSTLALLFAVRYTQFSSVDSHQSFSNLLRDIIIPIFNSGVSLKDSEFQHLSFSGCSTELNAPFNLVDYFKRSYPGMFMEGFNKDAIPNGKNGRSLVELYPLFIPCLNDKNRVQINAVTEEVLTYNAKKMRIPLEDIARLKQLFKTNLLSNNRIQEITENLVPEMKDVFQYWDECPIKWFRLSSVGIVIGAKYLQMVTGTECDLKNWM